MTSTLSRLRHVIAVLCGASVGISAAQDQPPSFRARADLVKVDVAVQQRGRPVTGLVASDFQLNDNGVPQRIEILDYGRLPIDFTIALDVSASVEGSTIDQLRRTVRELMSDAAPQDRIRVLTFNMRVHRAADFGASPSEIDAAFSGIRPSGGTAVLDAIAVALAAPASLDRRQLAVIFTDGEDEGSATTPDELLDMARHSTPTLGIVLAGGRSAAPTATSAASNAIRNFYEQLAAETGGFSRRTAPGQSLSSTFRQLLAEFRASYVLYFAPAAVPAGGFHRLDVHVNRPNVDVRARRGYTLTRGE